MDEDTFLRKWGNICGKSLLESIVGVLGRDRLDEFDMLLTQIQKFYENSFFVRVPLSGGSNDPRDSQEIFLPDEERKGQLTLQSVMRHFAKLRSRLRSLPPDDSLLLELRFGFVDGRSWSIKELARRWNVSEEYMSDRLRRLERITFNDDSFS